MNMRLSHAMLLLAACFAADAQAARKTLDETRPMAADGELSVSNVAGSITVEAWDRKEIHIGGLLGENVEKLEIDGDRESWTIEVRYPRGSRKVDETDLSLKVPRGVSVTLEAVSADIRVDGLRGDLEAQSVSGDVVANVDSREVSLSSVSGDIELRAQSRDTRLESVSGDIEAVGPSGEFAAETVSGDLSLHGGGPFEELEAQSVSGDIELHVALDRNADVEVETLSGTIELTVQGELHADVELATFSGRLHSDYHRLDGGGVKSIEFTVGEGRGSVELSSFSGDIELREARKP